MLKFSSILWRAYYHFMTDEERDDFISSFNSMPFKGGGTIHVKAEDVEHAKSILMDCVGDFEWEYYPDGLITSNENDPVYYGKFEIEQIGIFVDILEANGIEIKNMWFRTGMEFG